MKHTKISSKIAALLLCLCLLLCLAACGETHMEQTQIVAMDTIMTLTAYGRNAEKGLAAASGTIAAMDVMLDPELQTSTVYAINHANGSNTVISGQIAEMLRTSRIVYDNSAGAFDPTVYPLVKLWGFVDGKYYRPSDEEILSELGRLCFDRVIVNSFPSTGTYSVSLPAYGQLSFAASAKGCAAKNAVEAMRNAGVESGIISLGGNVQTLGLRPDGTEWIVAVQDPNNAASYLGVISAGETAVVTSGSYQRYFTYEDGKTYHHIIKPNTGYPANNTLLSVTILCEDGTMADCLSTAMFVLGESQAINYWRTYGGFEMILVTDENEIICTSGLIEKFTLANDSYTLRFTE